MYLRSSRSSRWSWSGWPRRVAVLRPSNGRPVTWVLLAAIALTACAPSARIYSVVPVDREGTPIDVSRIDLVRFDDGSRRSLQPGESLALVGQSLVIEGAARADGSRPSESFAVRAVESLRQPLADGTEHWIEVRTPADLDEFETLPRIQSIDTSDGRHFDLDAAGGRTARWSADRLSIVIEGGDAKESETVDLDAIARVELFAPDALGSTLASPGFWLVGAAAAGLVIWLADAQDEDSLATN